MQKVTLPATTHELEAGCWVLRYERRCRGCGAPIEFWETHEGKYIPLEADPGNDWKRRSHYESCPKRDEFRSRLPSPRERVAFAAQLRQGELFPSGSSKPPNAVNTAPPARRSEPARRVE